MKNRMVSGIKPTGTLTLGNYIGAIKNFVDLQNDNEMFVFVADLHALTIDIDPKELKENKKQIVALYLAAGLDPKKVVIFNQSDVAAHAQLAWILENQTTVGELSRMTQYKDKSQMHTQANGTIKIKTGMLTYPALMAADILLYKPNGVPVGQDQKQHLELTRNIAERFNNSFGNTFTIPEFISPKIGAKIMSLQNPEKKMSKTDKSAKSYITLLDDPEAAAKKIKKAVTDSEGKIYISDEKPGVKNLLTIYAALKDISIEEAEEHFKNSDYGQFKTEVAEVVKSFLEDLQLKYKKFLPMVEEIVDNGAKKAREIANITIKQVNKAVGL